MYTFNTYVRVFFNLSMISKKKTLKQNWRGFRLCVCRLTYTNLYFGQMFISLDSRCNNVQFSWSKALKDVMLYKEIPHFHCKSFFCHGKCKTIYEIKISNRLMMKGLIQSQWKKVDSFHFVLDFSQICHSISGLTAVPQTRKEGKVYSEGCGQGSRRGSAGATSPAQV